VLLLGVSNLTVSYGPVRAVRDLSLSVEEGEIVALLGPNGAGKSSTLKALMGLVSATAQRISLAGWDIRRVATEDIVRHGMTLTPEGRRVFAHLTVEENLRVAGSARARGAHRLLDRDELADLFPILYERRRQLAGTLSGGEQQQLAIARSLMSAPRLLLLDEPSLGLGPLIVDRIFELISRLRSHGLTILLVEQNVDRALEVSNRAYVLSTGQLELTGNSAKLRESADVERAYLGIGAATQ
jgi:branched-chain amino acid transport system ATP-binding protein